MRLDRPQFAPGSTLGRRTRADRRKRAAEILPGRIGSGAAGDAAQAGNGFGGLSGLQELGSATAVTALARPLT